MKKNGFTLVEMLIVIILLGLIGGVIIFNIVGISAIQASIYLQSLSVSDARIAFFIISIVIPMAELLTVFKYLGRMQFKRPSFTSPFGKPIVHNSLS